MGVVRNWRHTMNADSGVGALKSCTKLTNPSYAMPSASPYYTPFPAMDKSDISNDPSALLDLWGETSILHPTPFHHLSQSEAQTTCPLIGQSHTLQGCGNTNSPPSIESSLSYTESLNCSGNIQHQSELLSPQTETYQELDYQTIGSWVHKHPKHWSTREVLDWVYCAADQHGIDGSKLRGESFQTIRGPELCRMSRDDFKNAEPEYGDLYYQVFQNLLKSVGEFSETTPSPLSQFTDLDISNCLSSSPSDQIDRINQNFSVKTNCQSVHMSAGQIPSSAYGFPCPPASSANTIHQFSCSKHDRLCGPPSTTTSGGHVKCELDQYTDFSLVDPTSNNCAFMAPYYNNPHQAPMPGFHSPPYMSAPAVMGQPHPPPREHRRVGRPPKSKSVGCVADVHTRRDRRGMGKNQHLWEFIYDTLMNPMYSPQYLRWENKQDGIFRFVQSEAVAQLWGNLKNNDNMTYEKLSRAMRHYYKRGILERVEGRRLVYKFSSSAMAKMRHRLNSV